MHICTVNRANQTFMVMSQYGENGLVSAITEALYIEYRICEQIPKLWRLEIKLNVGSGQAMSRPVLNLHLTCKYVTYRFRYLYHESAASPGQRF